MAYVTESSADRIRRLRGDLQEPEMFPVPQPRVEDVAQPRDEMPHLATPVPDADPAELDTSDAEAYATATAASGLRDPIVAPGPRGEARTYLPNPKPPEPSGDLVLPSPGGATQAPPARPRVPSPPPKAVTPQTQRAEAEARMREENSTGTRARNRADQAARQQMADKARRRDESRRTGLAADPEKVKADAAAAAAEFNAAPRRDPMKEFGERVETSKTAQETAAYVDATRKWEMRAEELDRRRQAAEEDGTNPALIQSLNEQLAEHWKSKPAPSLRMTGGLTPQELREPIATTIEKLPEEERQAIKAHFLSRHAQRGANGELVSTPDAERLAAKDFEMAYADLEPEERVEVMFNDARRVMGGPKVPTMDIATTGSYGRGIGDNAKNEDLDPDTSRMVGTDLYDKAPRINKPGQRFGTFVQTETGSFGSRAANPTQLAPFIDPASPQYIETDLRKVMEQHGGIPPEMRQSLINLGVNVFGLDPSGFDNEGQFMARALDALKREKDKLKSGVAIPVLTGGYRYTPSEEAKAKQDAMLFRNHAMEFIKNHPLQEQNAEKVDRLRKLAEEGKVDEARALIREMQADAKVENARSYRAHKSREIETRALNNPNVAPGMLQKSLEAAGGDPVKVATVLRQFGMHDRAERELALENGRIAAGAEADLNRAKLEREQVDDPDVVPAWDANAAGARAAVDQAFDDTVLPEVAISSHMIARNGAIAATGGKPITQPQAAIELAKGVLSRGGRAAWTNGVVSTALQHILSTVWRDSRRWDGQQARDVFASEVERQLAPGFAEEAKKWYDANRR